MCTFISYKCVKLGLRILYTTFILLEGYIFEINLAMLSVKKKSLKIVLKYFSLLIIIHFQGLD